MVAAADLPTSSGLAFGLLDLPAEQRQPAAVVEARHGHVLVLGAAGSGRTTALAAIGAAAGDGARWLPADPIDLWDVLTDPEASTGSDLVPDDGLLLLDDLDIVLARCPADQALELADLVARLLREAPTRGIRIVAAAQRVAGPVAALAPAFGCRLLLRAASREELVLAGGDGTRFDPRAVPGSGSWDGAAVQVALPAGSAARSVATHPPRRVEVPAGGALAVVAAHPRRLAESWDPARVRIVRLGESDAGLPVVDPGRRVLLGDPDAWQADWTALSHARRELPMVFVGCSVADLRAVARIRDVPPPLRRGEAWLVEGGRVERAILDVPSAGGA
jgi:S-DNA-T family DNA segregation ATPase FtsK/SpoIIIE